MDATTIPETIGSFKIVSKLGQGGMGAVYRAVHGTLERPVALKILPAEFANNPEYVTRFLREARTVAALRHDNIVQVYDAGEERGQYFIAMELVEGAHLGKYVDEKKKITEEEGLTLLLQAAKGLAAAHAKGLVHRDIKPENMLLGTDNILRLVDFGLVMESTSTTQLTATGACLGTPMYMSPEQADGEMADARTDIYSLGVTFYRVFTGQPPFNSATVMNLLFKHKFEAPPDPKALRPDLSENARRLLLHMMAKRKEDRPQTAQALVEMIEGVKQGKPVPPPPVYVPPVTGATSATMISPAGSAAEPSANSKKGLLVAALVIGVLFVGALLSMMLSNKSSNTSAPVEKVDLAAKADAAYSAGQYADALKLYEQAVAEKPSDELAQKISRTKKTIEFENIMQSAEALEAKGDLDGAAARYSDAVALDSSTRAKERLERVKASIAQNKGLNNKERNTERDALSKKAADAEKDGKYELAAEHYSRAAALSENNLRIVFADKANECRRQDYLAKALAAEELKSYSEAEVWYKKALDLKPNDALVAQQLDDVRKKMKPAGNPAVDGAFDNAMREGQRAMDAADFARARAQFSAALALKPGHAPAAEKVKEAEGRELLQKGDAFKAAGNTRAAETAYAEAIQKWPLLAVEAAARIKALANTTTPAVAPVTPPVPASGTSALVVRIDKLVREQKNSEAMTEVITALRQNPGQKELKELKAALESIQAYPEIYAELLKLCESAFLRVRDFRDIEDDDRSRDLKESFEKLRDRFTGKPNAARTAFLAHDYPGVESALALAKRDADDLADALQSAAETCERRAEKAGEKSTGVKGFGISIGVGGDKRKAQKYRDVGESFKRLAEQAKAQSK
ncbi:MAG TPA: protein kinase [Planctomycetota bacterium]|nr:protein kinase [Planctomycetota bacterium]